MPQNITVDVHTQSYSRLLVSGTVGTTDVEKKQRRMHNISESYRPTDR